MSNRKLAIKGLLWNGLDRVGVQLITFGTSVFMMRMLDVADYGLLAMIGFVIGMGSTLVDAGFGQSLIRMKAPSRSDFSTVFLYNVGASIALYGLIFFSAPLIAAFFSKPILVDITRIYALIILFSAFSVVPVAKYTQELNFSFQTKVSVTSIVLSSALGIALAFYGYGVWSLVYMGVAAAFIKSFLYYVFGTFRPAIHFSREAFKHHFSYGGYLTLSSLLGALSNNLYSIVIGKMYTPKDLGLFDKSFALQTIPTIMVSNVVNTVSFPLLAKYRDDKTSLKQVFRKIMRMVNMLIHPLLIALLVFAQPILVLLYTVKWVDAVPYFQILCLYGIWVPASFYSTNIFKVLGKTKELLKLELLKRSIQLVMLVLVAPFGVIYIAVGVSLFSFISFMINLRFCSKYIAYTFTEQLTDTLPSLLISVMAAAVAYGLYIALEAYTDLGVVHLIAALLLGGLTYMGLTLLIFPQFKIDIMDVIKNRNV